MPIRAIRGASVVPRDDADAILDATEDLLRRIVTDNALDVDQIISVIFTATPDLTAEFPARAARRLGWTHTPLLGAVEMAVPGAPDRCIRVLLHVETDRPRQALRHVYVGAAAALRPDLVGND